MLKEKAQPIEKRLGWVILVVASIIVTFLLQQKALLLSVAYTTEGQL